MSSVGWMSGPVEGGAAREVCHGGTWEPQARQNSCGGRRELGRCMVARNPTGAQAKYGRWRFDKSLVRVVVTGGDLA